MTPQERTPLTKPEIKSSILAAKAGAEARAKRSKLAYNPTTKKFEPRDPQTGEFLSTAAPGQVASKLASFVPGTAFKEKIVGPGLGGELTQLQLREKQPPAPKRPLPPVRVSPVASPGTGKVYIGPDKAKGETRGKWVDAPTHEKVGGGVSGAASAAADVSGAAPERFVQKGERTKLSPEELRGVLAELGANKPSDVAKLSNIAFAKKFAKDKKQAATTTGK